MGGTDTASLINATTVESTTLRGGTGNDTIAFTGPVATVTVSGGAGADSFSFAKGSTGTSIYMGAGNDSISFSGTGGHATTTYYFGKTDGKDTLTFANVATSGGITIAVDAAYGSTAGILYSGNLDAGTGTSGTITFNNAESGVATGTLFLSNVTGGSEAQGAGITNITFVTVSTSTITALG